MLLLLMLIFDKAWHQRNKQHAEKEQEVEEKKGGEGGGEGGGGGGGGGRPAKLWSGLDGVLFYLGVKSSRVLKDTYYRNCRRDVSYFSW